MNRPALKVWVTRTAPDAEATAQRLRDLGHDAIVSPLLEVRPIAGVAPDLAGVSALAFASRNGVTAFASLSAARNLPVYTVGEATAQAAHAAGFGAVTSADGAFAELVALIALHPPAGRLLWLGPTEPAGDLVAALAPHGVECALLPIYETVETQARTPQGVDAVMVHSPKAARILARRLSAEEARPLRLFAISAHAAQPLSHLPFSAVEIAERPDETALLDLTVRPIGANQRTMTTTEPASPGPASTGASPLGATGAVPADPSGYRKSKGVSWPVFVLGLISAVVVGVAISRLVPGAPQTPDSPLHEPAALPWLAPAAREDAPPPAPANPAPAVTIPASGDVADLSSRLERIEADQRRTASAAGAALATTALLQAAQTSRPFTAELAAVQALLPQADTAALGRLAQTGAPTRSMLADEFAAAASKASAAARTPGRDAGFVAQARNALSNIVTIRRVEGGTGADAVIIRAEDLVRDGDLEGALAQMRRLPAPARTAFAPWIARAEPRIELDRRLAAVRAASIAELAASSAPPAGARP